MGDDEEETIKKYIKLVSQEGDEFFVERSIAVAHSVTIKTSLSSPFLEAREGVIRFPEIRSEILEKVVSYMHHKERYSHSTTRIPEFTIEPEIALELLIASKYLNC